jgi:hypothetical protein
LESDKLTSLIGHKTRSSYEVTTANDTSILRNKNSEAQLRPPNDLVSDFDGESERGGRGTPFLLSHQKQRSLLLSSKSTYFQKPKEKESLQRKLTYNLVQPQEEFIVPDSSSPSKSEKVA